MKYQINIFLDKTAQKVGGGGPHRDSFLAAHLWFKYTGKPPVHKAWLPVADPVTLSKQNDTVFFAMADIYGDLDSQAKYKVKFINPGGQYARSPFTDELTDQLAGENDSYYPWDHSHRSFAGLGVNAPGVRTDSPKQGLALTNLSPSGGFEFSIEVDRGDGSEVYYMDPRMIVGP